MQLSVCGSERIHFNEMCVPLLTLPFYTAAEYAHTNPVAVTARAPLYTPFLFLWNLNLNVFRGRTHSAADHSADNGRLFCKTDKHLVWSECVVPSLRGIYARGRFLSNGTRWGPLSTLDILRLHWEPWFTAEAFKLCPMLWYFFVEMGYRRISGTLHSCLPALPVCL